MSRTRISHLLTSSLITATVMAMVPVAFGATAQDIEHLRNLSLDQFCREANQRAEEQARQATEQFRQFEERSRQQAKDFEAYMQRNERERVAADLKARREAREKQLQEEEVRALLVEKP